MRGQRRVRHILVFGQSLRAVRRETAALGGLASAFILVLACVALASSSAKADAAFRAWIETLWPEAQSAGVKRATFDAAFKGLVIGYDTGPLGEWFDERFTKGEFLVSSIGNFHGFRVDIHNVQRAWAFLSHRIGVLPRAKANDEGV